MSATLHNHPMRNRLILAHHAAQVQRFKVSVIRADGLRERFARVGGTSAQHASDAMADAGLGSLVRVRAMSRPESGAA